MPRSVKSHDHAGRQPSLLATVLPDPLPCSPLRPCAACRTDKAYLRRKVAPTEPPGSHPVTVVDLFAGCGGMSVGLQEAARRLGRRLRVLLAVDSDSRVLELYRRNLKPVTTSSSCLDELFNGRLGDEPTRGEREVAAAVGQVDILLGGPPCQGHSDLNNRTRRADPKNALYLVMARAAEILKPRIILIENVAPVTWDKSKVVHVATEALTNANYCVGGRVLDLRSAGVPQRRHRYVLLACTDSRLDPATVLEDLRSARIKHPDRTVRWAIEDLLDVGSGEVFDTASRRSDENRQRMRYLFEHGAYDLPNELRPECHRNGDHSYKSVYGRLRWDRPAQTITTGFGSMGQGRYVHPSRRRTITPHEAARLQTFPDWFDFTDTPRGVLAKAIGNAVPPLLMVALGQLVMTSLCADLQRDQSGRRGAPR